MAIVSRAKSELSKNMLILKQLEGVLKTSNDPEQRRRVAGSIKEIRQAISNLQSIIEVQKKYGFSDAVNEEESEEIFKILNRIPVQKVFQDSHDSEMDALISYVDYFEKNYLPVLSEYYVKLDYNHALKRDTFYPRFMELKKIIKEYRYEIEVQSREEYNTIAVYKDKSVVYKMRQQYYLALDRYYRELSAFLVKITEDHASGGSIVLNPLDIINMSEFEVDRKLDGYTVINGIIEISRFCEEVLRFLAIPNL
jgi:hypothetical protein